MLSPSKVMVPARRAAAAPHSVEHGRRLAGAVEAEQHGGLARLHVEVDAVQHRQRAVAGLQAAHLEQRLRLAGPSALPLFVRVLVAAFFRPSPLAPRASGKAGRPSPMYASATASFSLHLVGAALGQQLAEVEARRRSRTMPSTSGTWCSIITMLKSNSRRSLEQRSPKAVRLLGPMPGQTARRASAPRGRWPARPPISTILSVP